jgi:DcaP outer membrane protein
MARKSIKKALLSLSVAVALGCSSGSIFADGDNVEALEMRVAELEALVLQLLQNQQAMEEVEVVEVAVVAAAVAEEKANEVLAEHEAVEAEKVHKHSYKFGGFVKTDVMYTKYDSGSYSGAGRDFYIPGTIPVGDGPGETYLDFHAKESRINFKSTHNLDNGAKMTSFIELDFQLPPGGNERVSNSFAPRIRHAFLTYNKWLVGQTWMTFFNVGALPENLDFVGPAESTIFGRQPMIRYTSGSWQFAVENPETTITPYGGGGRIVADDNTAPDLVGRYNMKGDWGTFTVAGMLRQLRLEDNAAAIKDSATGWGISLSGKFIIGEKDDFRWMASFGGGLGRYIGLNTANGAVLDADGNLHAIDSTGIFGSYRHFWSEQWRSNLTLGYLAVDNDVELTGMNVTKNAASVHVNLIYSPQPKLDFGVEFMYADREVESGADGDMKRLQFSAKFAF